MQQLHEANPMLGHRGDRLAITYPEILEMQVRAIIEAAVECEEAGHQGAAGDHDPAGRHEGGAGLPQEDHGRHGRSRVQGEEDVKVEYLYGTMIEVPRAAVTADEMAETAEFFSFGTNDLTQMTFGYQPRRRGQLPARLPEEGDPRARPVPGARRRRRRQAGADGRAARPADAARTSSAASAASTAAIPKSVEFCHEVGLNYVSCSPVPRADRPAGGGARGDQAGEREEEVSERPSRAPAGLHLETPPLNSSGGV